MTFDQCRAFRPTVGTEEVLRAHLTLMITVMAMDHRLCDLDKKRGLLGDGPLLGNGKGGGHQLGFNA